MGRRTPRPAAFGRTIIKTRQQLAEAVAALPPKSGGDPRRRCADVTIKVDYHAHTSADPIDRILHDAGRLMIAHRGSATARWP